MCGLICGNLGPSYRVRGMDVQDILFQPPEDKPFWKSRFGYSLRLGFLALSLAIVIGIPLGTVAALKQNTLVDYVSLFVATAGISVPNFVIAIFLIIIFASWLHLIPVVPKSWDDPRAWILPAAVLGFGTLAYTARLTRSSMLEVMRQDYVRTARAKGLAERLWSSAHMIKNALIPVVTIPWPGTGGSGDRFLYYRNHVRLPRHGPGLCAGDWPARLLDDHGHHADLCDPGGPGQPERGFRLCPDRSAHSLERVSF